jgi:hypothetical protein
MVRFAPEIQTVRPEGLLRESINQMHNGKARINPATFSLPVYPMNEPVNFISNDQVEIFNRLHDKQVRYLAFGSFAINAYEQARTGGTIKLWVEPSQENIARLNEALRESGQTGVNPEFDPERKRPLETLRGVHSRDTIGMDFYPAVNGFSGQDFGTLFERKQGVRASEITREAADQAISIQHMSLPDLYHNTGHTRGKAREYNLDILYKAGNAFKIKTPPLPEPSSFLKKGDLKQGEDTSKSKHMTQKAPERTFVRRDFEQIRRDLDMEVVLQHYGYQLSSKTKPKDAWRVYKSGMEGDSQRFAVMTNPKSGYKGFVELNNTSLRGDVFEFIKYKEGDFKSAFRVVDQMLGNPEFEQKARQLPPLKVVAPRQYLNDEKLRQSDLIGEYGISFLSKLPSNYLTEKRGLDPSTVQAPEFCHQILQTTRAGHTNIAFPLTSEKGNILTLDIRNENFKSFPSGSKGDALWKSNEHARLVQEGEYRVGDRLLKFEMGTEGTVSRSNGSLTFHTRHPQVGLVSFPLERKQLEMIPTNRIVVSESPIDSLSYHQLSPPQAGEYRRYVSAAGNPSREQWQHMERFVRSNPQAQFVIGMDGNPPGNRFAINLLGIKHPQRNDRFAIIPHVVYNNPTPVPGERGGNVTKEVGQNVLTLEIKYPIAREASYEKAKSENEQVIENLLSKMNRFQPGDKKATQSMLENLIEPASQTLRTISEIRFPNRGRLLEAALDHLTGEVARRDGQPLTAVIRPTATQNDFNDVLRNRSGKPLPDSSNLSLNKLPLPTFKAQHDILEQKKQNQSEAEQETSTQKKIRS